MIMQMNYNKILYKKISMISIMRHVSLKNPNLKKLKYLQFIINLIILNSIVNYFKNNLIINNKMIISITYYKKNYKISL